MRGAMGNVLSATELLRMEQSGQKAPDPSTSFLLAYNAPQYKQAVQDAMRKALTDVIPSQSVEIAVDFGKSTSDFDFGQTKVDGDIGLSWGGWFAFSANGQWDKTTENLETYDEESEIKIKLLFDDIRRVTINPGQW